MKRDRKLKISTTHIILFSFLAVILAGTLLLMLPVSSSDGHVTPFLDALFTATTATCVTGLVVLPTATAWSPFGQAVILLMIQIGGLGLITILAGLALFLHRKMKLSDSLLLQDAFNLNSLAGLGSFVKKVIMGTLAVEGVGALLYMIVFVPKFHWRGVWISVFMSVSAFCNAGMDVLSTDSLCGYVDHPLVNAVTCALIVLGGLGFIVWWDILRVCREAKTHKGSRLRRLTLHSKIALVSTAILLLVGWVLFFAFEYRNPSTMGELSLFGKLQASLFQSVTTRTAGFASVPQEALTNPSSILSLLLMFIGGSPVGTAGGMKTVTFTVLLAAAFSAVKNRRNVALFGRTVPQEAVQKAVGVCCMSFAILFLSTLLLSIVTDAPVLDVLYETASATATVGLSRNLTASLPVLGKWIVIVTMYLGRIGPISLAVAFNLKKENQNTVKDPTESISVG
jgi:trk system potassium uptake protein TrkH